MRIPVIKGIIRRRLLINFRGDPADVQRVLPHPFRPKLHAGHAILGICLIRLEQIRPPGVPGIFGLTSENAAHRVAVEWTDSDGMFREGVYIPRRDTSSVLNHLVGGRLFPGEHHLAEFSVTDAGNHVELSMHSLDNSVTIRVIGDGAELLPASSCFASVAEASAFFESGNLGYSSTRDGDRLDGLFLRTIGWRIGAFSVTDFQSSYFMDNDRFPEGSIEFDHALIMRDVAHEWHRADDLVLRRKAPDQSPDPGSLPAMSRAKHDPNRA